MILRIWTTSIIEGRELDYLKFARERSALMFLSHPGCLGVLFLKSADGKHAACSFWKSDQDIAALANSSSYKATVSDLNAISVLAGDATIGLYEVEGGLLHGLDFSTALEQLVFQPKRKPGDAGKV